ncbi:MAG TPA: response regulator [Chitinophagaceae bacterium]|nr:response regulator [Chitinophagaceae bacterium]
MNHKGQKTILYVDDDGDDRELLAHAIQTVDSEVNVVLMENGLKAMDYLNSSKEKKSALPCLIVLDLNMPYLNGRQTLELIRKDEGLQEIPVIIFSSSENPNDKATFNSLGIEYFTKPTNISFIHSIATHMVGACGQE